MTIVTFDSMDDLFTQIGADRKAADAKVRPFQAALKVGDFFVKSAYGITIYGEVLDVGEEERKAGADEEEIAIARGIYEESHMVGFRFTRCFSQACTYGELGDTHIATVSAVISKAQFDDAQKQGWPTIVPKG